MLDLSGFKWIYVLHLIYDHKFSLDRQMLRLRGSLFVTRLLYPEAIMMEPYEARKQLPRALRHESNLLKRCDIKEIAVSSTS